MANLPPTTLLRDWASELVVLEAADRRSLAAAAERLLDYTSRAHGISLRDIAWTLNSSLQGAKKGAVHRAAMVVSSVDDLSARLARLHTRLSQPECPPIKDREGLYYFGESPLIHGKVALMMPGEGSQYLNMLAELCLHFPEVRESFDVADGANSADRSRWPLSAVLFPPPFFSEEEEKAADARLWDIDRATEAVLTADGAMVKLIAEFGLNADMMVGHSAGEWVALAASGVLQTAELVSSMGRLTAMYRKLGEDREIPRMAMLAVGAGREKVESIVGAMDHPVHIANDNCPHQVVIVVDPGDAEGVSQRLAQKGVYVERLSFDRGYHTPVFTYMCDPLRACFNDMRIGPPRLPLYSCTTAQPYPAGREAILEMVTNTFARPLDFRHTIEAMYRDGARIFVEAGPRGNLSAFVDDILRGKPHLSVPVDLFRRPGLLSLHHALAMLAAAHVPLRLDPLYSRRAPRHLSWDLAKDIPRDEDNAPGAMRVSLLYPRLQTPTEPLPPRVVRETVYAAPAAAPPAAGQPRNGHAPAREEAPTVLDAHFALMQQFLETEEAVMNGVLGGGFAAADTAAMPAAVAADELPRHPEPAPRRDSLLRGCAVLNHQPGQEIAVRCEIDAREHLYLEDHCLYPRVPLPEAKGTGLFSMPLTGSLEMLAETAAMLCPEETVVGLRDILAPRWLDVEEAGPPTVVEISARRTGGDSVRATLRSGSSVLTEATVIFADRFPPAPPPLDLALRNERPPQCQGDDIYRQRRMFHGPRFHGVTGVERVGEDGVAGGLQVLAYDNLLRSDPNPAFHFDFFLLDAAGQLVGYWPSEYFEDGIVAVPVRVAGIHFYRRDLQPGERATCRVRLRSVTHRQLVADYDVLGADGRLWMRVTGWEDWRFHWGRQYVDFWRFPHKGGIGVPVEFPALAGADIECRRFDPPVDLDKTGLWEKLLMRLLLTENEIREYHSLPSAAARTAWATQKAIGKDAVHKWVQRFAGRDLYPSQIAEDAGGPVRLSGGGSLRVPYLSVDHRRQTAVAVASARPVGIALRSAGEEPADERLTAAERELMQGLQNPEEWPVRLRAAKAAVEKLLLGQAVLAGSLPRVHHSAGSPAPADPRGWSTAGPAGASAAPEFHVAEVEESSARIVLTRTDGAGATFTVYTARDGADIVAIALCEES
jgi:malonyl CoA-acyl carrier protein transacylase